MTQSQKLLALSAAAVLGLTACSETLSPVTDESVIAEAKITASSVSEDSIGKPTVPVTINYTFQNEPVVGEPLQISLNVSSSGVSGLSMAMTTRGSLALSKNTPAQIVLKSNVSPSATQSHNAVVVANAEGRSYLNVQITGIYEGQPFTKAVSIPVQVGQGGPTLQKNGEIIDTGIEVLSSMPASQTVEKEATTLQ